MSRLVNKVSRFLGKGEKKDREGIADDFFGEGKSPSSTELRTASNTANPTQAKQATSASGTKEKRPSSSQQALKDSSSKGKQSSRRSSRASRTTGSDTKAHSSTGKTKEGSNSLSASAKDHHSSSKTSKKTATRRSSASAPYVPPAPITAIVSEGTTGSNLSRRNTTAGVTQTGTKSSSSTPQQQGGKTERRSSSAGEKARRTSSKNKSSAGGTSSSDNYKPATTKAATSRSKTSNNAETMSSSEKERKSSRDKDGRKKSKKKSSSGVSKANHGQKFDDLNTPEPSSASGMRFDELYRLKGVLGTGAFSTVREGFHRSNANSSYAVKCVNRKKLSEEDEQALLDEVSILKSMKHIHIIRLYDFFAEPSTYYLVMERMRGGELFDRIVAKAYYNEKEARDTCKIVLEAVEHCHKHNVAHRDLKPENLLLLSEDDDSRIKIADFGFAKIVKEPCSLTTQCGTPGYVAPEILEGNAYDERADMWSVGVILYILLGGYPPFIESTQRDLFRKIRKGEYEFHEEYWGTVSTEAKELISSLLTVDPVKRLSATEGMHNSWITGDDADLAGRDLGQNLEKFKAFNARRKFKAVVQTIMAVNKLNFMGNALNLDALKSSEDA